jgi:hypothetical protein
MLGLLLVSVVAASQRLLRWMLSHGYLGTERYYSFIFSDVLCCVKYHTKVESYLLMPLLPRFHNCWCFKGLGLLSVDRNQCR